MQVDIMVKRPTKISIGGIAYIQEDEILDFLKERARLALIAICVRGLDPITTEFLRGSHTTLTEIINEFTP